MTIAYDHIRLKPDDPLAEELCRQSLEEELLDIDIPDTIGTDGAEIIGEQSEVATGIVGGSMEDGEP